MDDETMLKKMKKLYDKMKESIDDNQSLTSGLERLKDASSNGVQRVTYHTNRALAAFLTKLPLMTVFIYSIVFYIAPIFAQIRYWTWTLFGLITKKVSWIGFPEWSLGWFPIMITFMLFIFILVFLVPTRNNEWKYPIYKFESTTFFVVLSLLIIFGAITGPNESFADGLDIVKERGSEKSTNLWEELKCSVDPVCIQQKLSQKESENVRTEDFSIAIIKPNTLSYSFERFRNQNIYFKYDILSKNSAIKLERLDCYMNSDKKESNLISSIDLSNKGRIDNENKVTESGFYCQFNKSIDYIDEKNVKIIPVLYYSVVTTLSQEIPFQKVNSVEEIDDLRDSLILDKGKTSSSNDLLKLYVQTSNFDLPIFHGDGVYMEDEYIFDFKVKQNDLYTLGKLNSSKVLNYSIPYNIFEFQGYPIYNDIPEILTKDGESSFSFNLKLKQDGFEEDYFKENIRFEIESKIRKKDTFTIEIIDYDKIVGDANKAKLEEDKSYDEYKAASDKLKQQLTELKIKNPGYSNEIDLIMARNREADSLMEQVNTLSQNKYPTQEDLDEIDKLSIEAISKIGLSETETLELIDRMEADEVAIEENSLSDENAADNVQG